jgi:hypothetical protein
MDSIKGKLHLIEKKASELREEVSGSAITFDVR